jgi:hypothetical protein
VMRRNCISTLRRLALIKPGALCGW